MMEILSDPTQWEELKTDNEGMERFLSKFSKAESQLNTVMQYYEFEWDVSDFGIDEHEWLRYTGAYKNLKPDSDDAEDKPVATPLIGKSKLSGTQVIDADHILKLIGSKVSSKEGIQTVDTGTLIIIHQQIQELSDMGEDTQAKLLKEFVDTELVKDNLSSDFKFDELFEDWKQRKVDKEVEKFAEDWGVEELLSKSLDQFSLARKDEIPYIDELQRSVDYEEAVYKEAGNPLEHTINFVNEALPEYLVEMKKIYK